MSSELALREMDRFLGNADSEVLSVSGRWGVGKTYGWVSTLQRGRAAGSIALKRYSYVSAFGVKSLPDLKTAVFQSTVRLDAKELRPSVASLQENLKSIEGIANIAESGGRHAGRLLGKIMGQIPWIGPAADLIMPAAGLLIRNQIICIDDIERAGTGLTVPEILGFVSSMREERGCKVVLLLNEEGLGAQTSDFRRYLEKVVDQAIEFTPTPHESSSIALGAEDPLSAKLKLKTESLGITNIRIIKRIRRFLRFLEPLIEECHPGVLEQAINTIALFGWSIFEPDLAPDTKYLRNLLDFSVFSKEPSAQEAGWNALISSYGFSHADEFDNALIDGLLSGGFDEARVKEHAAIVNEAYEKADVREGIRAPWKLFGGSFEDNAQDVVDALVESVRTYGDAMGAGDLNSVVKTLRELGDDALANEMITLYMDKKRDRPRQYFELSRHSPSSEPLDEQITAAFNAELATRPLERNPTEILLKIDRESGWSRSDIEFLASLTADQYYELFKRARGDDLRSAVRAALSFLNTSGVGELELAVSKKAQEALERISTESEINRLRLRPYLPRPRADPPGEAEVAEAPDD